MNTQNITQIFNFREDIKKAKKKLRSLGYEHIISIMHNIPNQQNFGLYYVKYDSKQNKKVGSTWLNRLTLTSILEAANETEIPQLGL